MRKTISSGLHGNLPRGAGSPFQGEIVVQDIAENCSILHTLGQSLHATITECSTAAFEIGAFVPASSQSLSRQPEVSRWTCRPPLARDRAQPAFRFLRRRYPVGPNWSCMHDACQGRQPNCFIPNNVSYASQSEGFTYRQKV